MDRVRLLTRRGHYVTTVTVPPMTPPPEVIDWGSRSFIRQPDGTYVEGIVWVAPLDEGASETTEGQRQQQDEQHRHA